MTHHRYCGCSAVLQFVAMGVGLSSIFFAGLGLARDIHWNAELSRIQSQFNSLEIPLLERKAWYWEFGFMVLELLGILSILVHTVFCFRYYKIHFHLTKRSRMAAYIIGTYFILVSIVVLISAFLYNRRLLEVISMDTRKYRYKEEVTELDGSQFYSPSKSVYQYCQWASGRPRSWGRLKGLRIKKTHTAICQRLGSKIMAAVLSCSVGVLYILMNSFLNSNRRDKEAAHVVLLFELFGDHEEAMYEYNGRPFLLREYKRNLLKRNFKRDLTPRAQALLDYKEVSDDEDDVVSLPSDNSLYDEEVFVAGIRDLEDAMQKEGYLDLGSPSSRPAHKDFRIRMKSGVLEPAPATPAHPATGTGPQIVVSDHK